LKDFCDGVAIAPKFWVYLAWKVLWLFDPSSILNLMKAGFIPNQTLLATISPHPKSLSLGRGILNLAPFSLGRRAGDEG
jgi:hypothetical protein